MMLHIRNPGMYSTVQDLGRAGHASIGVPVSGAADTLALRAGNAIVGNAEGAAAVEMTMLGVTVSAAEPVTVAIAGTAEASVGGSAVACWESIALAPGDELAIGRIREGVRAYLCVRGGVATPDVMGSRSTLVSACLGGYEGRILHAGDRLPIEDFPAHIIDPTPIIAEARASATRRTLRICPGPRSSHFGSGAFADLANAEFTVSPRSDRAGIRLTPAPGHAFRSADTGRMVSEGMMPGAIQAPAGGEPIILGPDGPTTGGYPVLAVVAAVDLPTLGQFPPLARVRFEPVTAQQARILYRERLTRLGR